MPERDSGRKKGEEEEGDEWLRMINVYFLFG